MPLEGRSTCQCCVSRMQITCACAYSLRCAGRAGVCAAAVARQPDASRRAHGRSSEALALAAMNATTRLAQPDGFWGNARVRIPLAGHAGADAADARAHAACRAAGSVAGELEPRRRAHHAAGGALFTNAVRTMTIADAIEIVRGGDDSATRYLRGAHRNAAHVFAAAADDDGADAIGRVHADALGVARSRPRQHDDGSAPRGDQFLDDQGARRLLPFHRRGGARHPPRSVAAHDRYFAARVWL